MNDYTHISVLVYLLLQECIVYLILVIFLAYFLLLIGISKEKVCDDTAVELLVEARAEWVLLRPPYLSSLHPPLSHSNPLLTQPESSRVSKHNNHVDDERWLSQVRKKYGQ